MATAAPDLAIQGRTIVEQLGGKWAYTHGMCRCPVHDDRSPSLSVRVGASALLFHCFAGCTTEDIMSELRRSGCQVRSGEPRAGDFYDRDSKGLQAIIDRLWKQGRGVSGTLASDYLASRHLASYSAQLRFHPRVQLGSTAEATYHPALLSSVRNDAGLTALHRTFLDPAGGKARFDNPKRLLGMPGRGAVRIGQPSRVLGLAEGVETAIAAAMVHGIPVWAVLGNERFGTIAIPAHVETLVLLADNDAGGDRAIDLALEGQKRPGLTIEVVDPPEHINDWCDFLADAGTKKTG